MKDVIVPCTLAQVTPLFHRYHAYASVGIIPVYCYGVREHEIIAAYVWQPPAPGAAISVCPTEPQAVLALSRMVAVPREDRYLRHVSKPLRRQMTELIDRTRWPVLITYSDESLGHNGYVYQCSGWTPTTRARRRIYQDSQGRTVSLYSGGVLRAATLLASARDGYSGGNIGSVPRRRYLSTWLLTGGTGYRRGNDGVVATSLSNG